MPSRSQTAEIQNHPENRHFFADYFAQLLDITTELASFFCGFITRGGKISRKDPGDQIDPHHHNR